MAPLYSSFSLLVLMLCLYLATSQELSSFTITSDSINPGDGTPLTISIYWNTHQYDCLFTPNATQLNYAFNCNPTSWTDSIITPNPYIQYYIKLSYDAQAEFMLPISFVSMQLTDAAGNTYTINDFCIR